MHGQTDGRQVEDTSGDTWCCPADVNEEDVASMPGENGCIEIDDLEFESESGKYLFKNFLVIRETLYLKKIFKFLNLRNSAKFSEKMRIVKV